MIYKNAVPQYIEADVNLLIADDDRSTLDLLMYKTESIGWKGKSVTSASQILQAMDDCTSEDDCYDAIIADINFFDNQSGPRMTGITAIRQVRKVLPNIPVIFVTAFINSITKEEIRRVNAELVAKPFDIDALYGQINDMVRWHRASQLGTKYKNEERRKTSVNHSGFQRRVGDKVIKPPERVLQILHQLREEQK